MTRTRDHKEPVPGEMHTWEQVDKSDFIETTSLVTKPESYVWYKRDGQWYPHRAPTIQEILDGEFK